MHESLLIHHEANVILARPRLEEDQIAWLWMTTQWPCCRLLLGRDARNAHSGSLMRDQRQATAIQRLMGRLSAIDIGGPNLG